MAYVFLISALIYIDMDGEQALVASLLGHPGLVLVFSSGQHVRGVCHILVQCAVWSCSLIS